MPNRMCHISAVQNAVYEPLGVSCGTLRHSCQPAGQRAVALCCVAASAVPAVSTEGLWRGQHETEVLCLLARITQPDSLHLCDDQFEVVLQEIEVISVPIHWAALSPAEG